MSIQTLPAPRVLFGAGVRWTVQDELQRIGGTRALVLSTPHQSDAAMRIAEALGPLAAGVYARAQMHTPVHITEDAVAYLKTVQADCIVSIGGGSTTGLGKAIVHRTGVAHVTIPTTYAGSEATPILGQTENGTKTTLSDPRVVPDVVLYDPELIVSLPVEMTVTSALNAIAHAAEALYAPNRTPDSDALATQGMACFAKYLPDVIADPSNLKARQETQRGAYACGAVLGQVGMALHHKLCHTLGGAFDLPHAATHAIILPHAISYNSRAARLELGPVCEIFVGETPGLALHNFAAASGAPLALRDLGVTLAQLDDAADLATQKPYPNPARVTRDGIRQLLEAAWSGAPPQH
ncbi:maleylacetate reductase [uncultured Tateyamaria sp.]|uniref:maleylacetate reductase n=1 Tax=uncultured Tateyamaria sp. TaxID=455651 RepID=UPI00260F10EC|nr:maleylacetate reductase [uncultured Tateyamaria sp.]